MYGDYTEALGIYVRAQYRGCGPIYSATYMRLYYYKDWYWLGIVYMDMYESDRPVK